MSNYLEVVDSIYTEVVSYGVFHPDVQPIERSPGRRQGLAPRAPQALRARQAARYQQQQQQHRHLRHHSELVMSEHSADKVTPS